MKKFLPRSLNNPSGFTLIELLVVISIIAFLSVIGIVAFTDTQKTARDGRRRGDVDAIVKAMESNYNPTTGEYTAWTDTMFASGTQPKDPSTGNNYAGNTVNSTKGFWVCATLDKTTQGNASSPGGAASTSTYPTFASNSTLYCRASQQSR